MPSFRIKVQLSGYVMVSEGLVVGNTIFYRHQWVVAGVYQKGWRRILVHLLLV